jgi:hypothetical protein
MVFSLAVWAVEAAVLPKAAGWNTSELRRAVRRTIARLDPNGVKEQAEVRKQDRRVEFIPMDDCMAELRAYLPAADATRIYQKLDAFVKEAAIWKRILTDPASGNVLDYGRKTYSPPAALADQVRARDKHCVFPGCMRIAKNCDIDHRVPYPEGPTSADNLACLCRHHHRLKHEAGWTLDRRGDHHVWTTPTGATYVSG